MGKANIPDVEAEAITVGNVYSVRYRWKRYDDRVAAISAY